MASKYKLGPQIGKGAYGRVYKAIDLESDNNNKNNNNNNNNEVAVKVVDLEDASEIEDLQREITNMATSDTASDNLITYYGSYVVESELWIIMEYLDGGSLADVLKFDGVLDEISISFLLKKLISALTNLHDDRKLHRDVKAGNILVSTNGAVKLADFGATGQLSDSINKRKTRVGTPFWMAPEVIMESLYDGCADIWSTGITAIEFASGFPPLAQEMHPMQAMLQIPKIPPPSLEAPQTTP